MKALRTPFLVILFLCLWANGLQAGEVVVEDAWVRLPPPQSTAAAFLTVRNGSDEAIVLVGAESPLAGRVEIHQSLVSEGVASMEEVESVVIPAGEALVLAPKGMHLMLFEPGKLTEGAEVPLELKFKPAQTLSTRAVVRRVGSGKHGAGGHHAHH